MRNLTHHVLIVAIALCLAAPASANQMSRDNGDKPTSVPILLDVALLRPIGLVMTTVGAIVYAFPVAPIVAITRPGDLWKPFGPLVAEPGKYTFSDPLGQH